MSHCLFVYGTLMRGQEQAHFLNRFRRRPARVRGSLWALPAGYPALGPGADTVFGELVEDVPDGLLALLDTYEGVAQGLYERRLLRVRVDTEVRDAWVYWMADASTRGGVRLRTGRFEPVRRR